MNVTLFEEITTEQVLQKLEADGVKYTGLYVNMDNKEERKYIKDNALLINDLLKKLDRARIDKARDHKISIEAEAKSIRERLEAANKPFTQLIDAHKEKRAAILVEEKAKKDAEELRVQVEADYDTACMLDKIRDIEAAEQEQERIDNEKKIADEAAEDARLKAERAARDELARAEQVRIDAEAAKKAAEQKLIDEQERSEREAKEVADKVDADKKAAAERAEREKQQLIDDERERVEQEKRDEQERNRIAKQKADKAAANKAHQKKKNNRAVDCFVTAGLEKEVAIQVVTWIAKGMIEDVTINYHH